MLIYFQYHWLRECIVNVGAGEDYILTSADVVKEILTIVQNAKKDIIVVCSTLTFIA